MKHVKIILFTCAFIALFGAFSMRADAAEFDWSRSISTSASDGVNTYSSSFSISGNGKLQFRTFYLDTDSRFRVSMYAFSDNSFTFINEYGSQSPVCKNGVYYYNVSSFGFSYDEGYSASSSGFINMIYSDDFTTSLTAYLDELATNFIDEKGEETINKIDYDALTETKPVFDGFVDLDFNDTDTNFLSDFRLENFKADYEINATWDSIHVPTKLQQWIDKGSVSMDDIGIMVMFTYTNKNFPATDKYERYYPTLLSASDLKASINIADFQSPDDIYYLSDVAFIPIVEFTYYNSGMGVSMNPLNLMYYGSINHVYFKNNGSAGGSAFDSGDINGSQGGGFAVGNDNYTGWNGFTGDMNDSLNKFSDIITGFSSMVGKVPEFISHIFSFLPAWVIALLGCVLAVIILLRILGR